MQMLAFFKDGEAGTSLRYFWTAVGCSFAVDAYFAAGTLQSYSIPIDAACRAYAPCFALPGLLCHVGSWCVASGPPWAAPSPWTRTLQPVPRLPAVLCFCSVQPFRLEYMP